MNAVIAQNGEEQDFLLSLDRGISMPSSTILARPAPIKGLRNSAVGQVADGAVKFGQENRPGAR
jgi:hypothetical protein